MTDLTDKQSIQSGDKARLRELITDLREKESLALLSALHKSGHDTTELLFLCMEGVRKVGLKFEQGEYYISALIMAGEIMRQAAEYLNAFLPPVEEIKVNGHVLLGTIKGDIHELGKNILKDMLQCNGFKVTDLGVDVPVDVFVEKTRELEPDLVAISCLLTNCLDNLAEAVQKLRNTKTKKNKQIIVGGHCIDELVNNVVNADRWFSDAVQAVIFCQETLKSGT